jgi:hypothetical protein
MSLAGAAMVGLGIVGAFGLGRHAGATAPPPTNAGGAGVPPPHVVRSTTAGGDQLAGYPGIPERVVIPALGVRAPIVEEVEVQARGPERGLLTAPANPLEVGWYRYRDIGALLVVGHVGDQSTAGALAYIGSLAAGGSFSVTFARGARTYRVVSVVHVRKGGLSRSLFRSAADGEVVLITCDYKSPFHNGHFADNVYVVGAPA